MNENELKVLKDISINSMKMLLLSMNLKQMILLNY